MNIDYYQEVKNAINKRDYVSTWNHYAQALIKYSKDGVICFEWKDMGNDII
ncbi:hypothetical protein Glove_365g258 [Diversispora epigaea]|uniref:Uncharacterized protein n=1 Tax=Diversispora epigaea TaxID=1348612 RepID=A0A397H7R8_9GLOM|nr:hypothetical protein Glove_365g258 [Diversispora epigaea]